MKSIEQKIKDRMNGKGKVVKFQPKRDKDGLYLPICGFEHHYGVITDDNSCRKLKCKHYLKMYVDF